MRAAAVPILPPGRELLQLLVFLVLTNCTIVCCFQPVATIRNCVITMQQHPTKILSLRTTRTTRLLSLSPWICQHHPISSNNNPRQTQTLVQRSWEWTSTTVCFSSCRGGSGNNEVPFVAKDAIAAVVDSLKSTASNSTTTTTTTLAATLAVPATTTRTTTNTEYRIHDDDDETKKRIFVTNPKHGFRIVPFAWKELQQICDEDHGGDLSKLSRSVPEQYKYTLYRHDLESTWKSITDHILCSKFNFDSRVEVETGLRYAHPSLSKVLSVIEMDDDDDETNEYNNKIAVLPNDFPYFVDENIEHWVLWKLGKDSCSEQEIDQAKKMIQLQRPTVIDFIHWTNPPHLKSIPEIDHVHILCLQQHKQQRSELRRK